MIKVLIADDSAFMRRVLREMLLSGGYEVIGESADGLEAAQDYKELSPDLVLMDYNMPKLKGIDSAKQIFKHDPTACIVMVTSLGSKKKLLEALRIGVKNYITKPFQSHTLLGTLKKILGDKAPIAEIIEESDDFQVIGSSFGQYLLQKGVISKEVLLKALETQNSINRKIGEIAVEEGLILPEKVDKILKVQKRINKYFGQLSVQMGLLCSEQVKKILDIQQKHYIDLENVMVSEKLVSKEKIEEELKLFKMLDQEDQGVYGLKWIKENLENGLVFEIFAEQTLKLLMRLTEYFVLEGDCNFENKEMICNGITVELSFSGDFNWKYFLNLSSEVAQCISETMVDMSDEEMSEDIDLEVAGEFVNIVCGNAISKLDNYGIKFEMTPPKIKKIDVGEKIIFPVGKEVLTIPILVPEGQVDLAIIGKNIFSQKEK